MLRLQKLALGTGVEENGRPPGVRTLTKSQESEQCLLNFKRNLLGTNRNARVESQYRRKKSLKKVIDLFAVLSSSDITEVSSNLR